MAIKKQIDWKTIAQLNRQNMLANKLAAAVDISTELGLFESDEFNDEDEKNAEFLFLLGTTLINRSGIKAIKESEPKKTEKK
jgi:hypothetical protein